MDCDITEFRPRDQEELERFFGEMLHDLGHPFDLAQKDADLRRIPEVYQSAGGAFLLARQNETLIGTIALRQFDLGICELKRFYVRRDHRRRGLGRALLGRILDHAHAGPWGRLRLDTTCNSPALPLFCRCGFTQIPRYNDDPFAEVFLELSLRASAREP